MNKEDMDFSEFRVERIKNEMAKPFILMIHYARRMPSISYCFGLFRNDEMIGVCTFGQPATPMIKKSMLKVQNNDDLVLELNRLVILPSYNGGNCGSFFVSKCLKMLPKSYVVSYADSGWSHCGYVYQATNWYYTGISKGRVNHYCHGHHARHSKTYNDTDFKQIETDKYRYIYLVGNKKEKKEMMKNITWEILKDYPKTKERQYDTDNPVPYDSRLNKPLDKDLKPVEVEEIDLSLF